MDYGKILNKDESDILLNWKNKDEIKVTVICLSYNHENTIAECLNSILSQDFPYPFEVIVNDDCSTDGSREIINLYASKYPRIIKPVFQNTNQYSKGALCSMIFNLITNANGRYISYCECDDFWVVKNKLTYQYYKLKENKNLYMHIMDARAIDINNDSVYMSKLRMLGASFRVYDNKELQNKTFLMLLTTMHLKPQDLIVKRYYNKTISFDSLLQKILTNSNCFSDKQVLTDCEISSVYRVLPTGIWSGLECKSKYFETTYHHLVSAQFYFDKNKDELSHHEVCNSILGSIRFVGVFVFFKFMVFNIVKKIFIKLKL